MSIALMLGMFTPAIATENLPGPPEKKEITLQLQKDKAGEPGTELPAPPTPSATNEDAAAADKHNHGGGVIVISGTTLLIIIILLIILL